MKKIFCTRINNKGFTLTELLATLAVLSLVCTIVVYTAINLIGKTKENSYQVTINNVEKVASTYVLEDNSFIDWIDGFTNDYEYQCVTVQNLIEKGFFKSDVLESYVSEDTKVENTDYIYLERDKSTKAITKKILLVGIMFDRYKGFCTDIESNGNINFRVVPSPDLWAQEKDVTITYKVNNNLDVISNYKYYYELKDTEVNYSNDFNKSSMVEKINLTNNGEIIAEISDKVGNLITSSTFEVEKIDRVGPIILANYNGEKIVRRSVTIPLNIDDVEVGSGLDVSSDNISLSDFDVYIGESKVSTGLTLEKIDDNNYNLKIDNLLKMGELYIIVQENNIFDNVKNGNSDIKLTPGVTFSNIYTINYNANGGTSGSMSNTTCTYGSSCKLTENLYTRTGYTFIGWNTKADGSGISYTNGYQFDNYQPSDDVTLYAQWQVNTVTIKYNVNGGVIATAENSKGTWTKDAAGLVYLDGKLATSTINYGEKTIDSGLFNYNNKDYLNISRTHYTAVDGKQWICLSGCTSEKTYNQYSVYNAEDFCDASDGNCEVVVGVNWKIITYTLTIDPNGGKYQNQTTNTVIEGNSGTSVSIENVTPPSGYVITFNGNGGTAGSSSLTSSKSFSGWTHSGSGSYVSSSKTFTYTGDSTLTANYTDGSITLPNATRTGYIFKGWYTAASGGTKVGDAGSSYSPSSNITLYAQWQVNSVTINANKFVCEGDRRLGVYYVTSCVGNDCTYTKKNGLNNTYSFSLDNTGIPTWSIDKLSYSDSLSGVGSACYMQLVYVNASSLNCRNGASTSNTNVEYNWGRCTKINVYRTTMKINNTHNWFYSSTYGCYLYGEYLSTSEPSSCSSDETTCTWQNTKFCLIKSGYTSSVCSAYTGTHLVSSTLPASSGKGCTKESTGNGYELWTCSVCMTN